MTLKIVTDSTCDLPLSIIDQYGITVLPIYINIGNQSFLDGIDISREEFYNKLPGLKAHPTTSAPGTGVFIEAYQKLVQKGASEILSIHISNKLSNISNIARLASQAITDVPVVVLDSGQLSLGTGLMVLSAARETAINKATAEEVVVKLRKQMLRIHVFAVLGTLKYLKQSGRMNHLQYGLGTLLDIKPILTMNNGQPKMQIARTNKNGINRLVKLVTDLGPLESLAIVHTHAQDKAEALYQETRTLFPEQPDIFFEEITPVIGAHIGPGAVGFVAVQKDGG